MKSTHTFPRSRRSAEHVLDLLAGLLDLRLLLIGLALGLELAVSRGLAGRFLRLPLGGLCSIAGLVLDFAHLNSSVMLRAASSPDAQQIRALMGNRVALPQNLVVFDHRRVRGALGRRRWGRASTETGCLLYTSDAADDLLCVDLGG